MLKKILYISGTRADYGLMKTTLLAIQKNPGLKLEIAATGMHLMPEFGSTIKEIEKDKLKISRINAVYKKDNKESMANFIGKFICLLTEKIKKIKPDIILVMGDRAEMLAGAVVGAYLGIPVAHIHGGEVSSTVDDAVRNSITKLADFHLPATKKSAERIIRMGEDKNRVKIIGAPGLEDSFKNKLSEREIIKKYKIDDKKPLLIVIQHPVSEEARKSGQQMEQTMRAVKELKYQTIVIYPNADAGGREMIKVIEKYRHLPFVKIYKSIPREDFAGLMKIANVLIGNSSAGMVESASFNLPVINIGTRQNGRERGNNVFDVNYNKKAIKKAIEKTVNAKKRKYKNPYFLENTEEKIAKILEKLEVGKK